MSDQTFASTSPRATRYLHGSCYARSTLAVADLMAVKDNDIAVATCPDFQLAAYDYDFTLIQSTGR